jgi:predicted aspartyl protease
MKSICPRLVLAVTVAGGVVAPLRAEIIKESAPLFTRMAHAVAVPAEFRNHFLFVNVMVNGQGPFRVFIDTGCSVTIFSPELATAVKARPAPDGEATATALNSRGNPLTVPRAFFDSVELGGARFEGVIAGVLSLTTLSQIDNRRIDGVLGFSLFSEVFLGLDYPGRQVLLGPSWPENLPPLRAEMPVHEHAKVPFIAAELQDKSFEVEIDSGSNGCLHLPAQLATALSWKAEPRPGPLIEAINEEARDYLGRLNGRLTLGGLELPEPVAAVGGSPPSIGYDLLSRFCVVFDQRADKVRFWRIAGVIPGSPAEEAGLAAGDLIVRIEDRLATEWSRDQIHDWVETGSAMGLRVVSGGASRDLRLRVWLLVP